MGVVTLDRRFPAVRHVGPGLVRFGQWTLPTAGDEHRWVTGQALGVIVAFNKRSGEAHQREIDVGLPMITRQRDRPAVMVGPCVAGDRGGMS